MYHTWYLTNYLISSLLITLIILITLFFFLIRIFFSWQLWKISNFRWEVRKELRCCTVIRVLKFSFGGFVPFGLILLLISNSAWMIFYCIILLQLPLCTKNIVYLYGTKNYIKSINTFWPNFSKFGMNDAWMSMLTVYSAYISSLPWCMTQSSTSHLPLSEGGTSFQLVGTECAPGGTEDVSLLYADADDVAISYEYLQGRRPCTYSHGIG